MKDPRILRSTRCGQTMSNVRSRCRLVLIALAALACSNTESVTACPGCWLPPPAPLGTLTIRALSDTGGTFSLQVSEFLQNSTANVTFSVGQCPLRILLHPGVDVGGLSGSDGCPAGSPVRVLAPGDTETMSRVLGPDTLASFAPGPYSVSVAIGYSYSEAGQGGSYVGSPPGVNVQLPLDSALSH